MKLRYCFTLAVALMVLLSLACVAASENMTEDLSVQEDDLVSLDSVDNQDELSLGNEVDLSVDMNVTPSYIDGKYNPVGSEVPWNVTVGVSEGTARNTQVRCILSSNLGYVSHNATVGEYDVKTGIWNIGDLNSSSTASLTILTKLNRQGTYLTKVYALTDSNDKELLNNFKFISIETGSSKITSNITETTDDRIGPSHDAHYASMMHDRISGVDKSSDTDNHESKRNSHSKSNPNNVKRYSPTNTVRSIQSILDSNSDFDSYSSDSIFNSVADFYFYSFDSIFNSVADFYFYSSDSILNLLSYYDSESNYSDSNTSFAYNLKNDSLNMFVGNIQAYDYLKIPILIFSLFLLTLFSILIYDKITN